MTTPEYQVVVSSSCCIFNDANLNFYVLIERHFVRRDLRFKLHR